MKVSISTCKVGPLCAETIYINDHRVCGMKPNGSESVDICTWAEAGEIFKAINKDLSPQELMLNEHVKKLVDALEEIKSSYYGYEKEYCEDENFSRHVTENIIDKTKMKARSVLKEFREWGIDELQL